VADAEGNDNSTLARDAGSLADREYFGQVMEGQTVITGPLLSRSTDQRVIIVATPIWNQDRTAVQGVLGLSMDLEELLRVSRDLRSEERRVGRECRARGWPGHGYE